MEVSKKQKAKSASANHRLTSGPRVNKVFQFLAGISRTFTSIMIAGAVIALLYSSARQPNYICYLVVFLPGFVLMVIAAANSPGSFGSNLYYLLMCSIVAGSFYLGVSLFALIIVFMAHGRFDFYAIGTLALSGLTFWKLRSHVNKWRHDNCANNRAISMPASNDNQERKKDK